MAIILYCNLPIIHKLVPPSKLYPAIHEQTPTTHSAIEYVQSAFKVHVLPWLEVAGVETEINSVQQVSILFE